MIKTVKDIQLALLEGGYDLGPDGADGDWGENSAKALAQFQLNNRLPVDGSHADEATMRLLFPDDYQARNDPMKNILGTIWTGLLGNLLNWQVIQGWLRGALYTAAGATGYVGFVGQDGTNITVAAILAIAGVLFSALSGNTKAKALDVVKAVDAAPDVYVVPAAKTVDNKPIVTTK